MTDTRMVRLEQIARGPMEKNKSNLVKTVAGIIRETGHMEFVRCKQIADPTGGDVFEPIDSTEAAYAEAARRAKWPHPVQVEVVNG